MAKKEKSKGSATVITPVFRCSFPCIVNKGEMSDKFEITMLFKPDDNLDDLKKAAKQAAQAKWPKGKPSNFRSPFRKAEDFESSDGIRYDGYEDGMTVISARSQYRPGVVDKNRNPIEIEDIDSVLYGGCYCRAAVNAFAYDRAGNRGVSFGLQALQIVKDGEPLGGRVNAEQVFTSVENSTMGDDEWMDDSDDEDLDL